MLLQSVILSYYASEEFPIIYNKDNYILSGLAECKFSLFKADSFSHSPILLEM